MPLAAISRTHSSLSTRTDAIEPTPPGSLFGLGAGRKSIGSPGWCARSAENTWKARSYVVATAPVITPASLKIPMATSWKSAAAKNRSLPATKTTRCRYRKKCALALGPALCGLIWFGEPKLFPCWFLPEPQKLDREADEQWQCGKEGIAVNLCATWED